MRQGDREVLVDQGGARRITWSTLDKRVDACAVVLRDAGIGRGDAVGLLLHNYAEFVEVMFATNRVGAVVLPLNWRLDEERGSAYRAEAELSLEARPPVARPAMQMGDRDDENV
jgi:fatty-acyl-CoA synthase